MSDKQKYIEKLKERKLRHYVAPTSTVSMPKYKQYYNDAIDAAIRLAEEILKDPSKPKTNGDIIRAMSDEEMAISPRFSCRVCIFKDRDSCSGIKCKDGILEYLKQEVKDE